MKNPKKLEEQISQQIFYLNHEIRRPLSNVVGISEVMLSNKLSKKEKSALSDVLQKALKDFDQVLSKYDQVINFQNNSIFL